MKAIELAETGRIPDPIVRAGIRHMLRRRLAASVPSDPVRLRAANQAFFRRLAAGPVAESPDRANDQHYEVAARFFETVLGPRLKYSCSLFAPGVRDLASAEEAMLALTAERAQIEDGMAVLDLGCGWGSFALWAAERFPASPILAVSNSKSQREYIAGRAATRGLDNVEVLTRDVNRFEADRRFDRVVSVEMFEHVRNHGLLLERIHHWLVPGGKLFVHHFAHREAAYPYEDAGEDDWMARHFFSGGIMPSDDLLLHHQRHLAVEDHWRVLGTHYRQTCEAWLARMDAQRETLLPTLAQVYGADSAETWFVRWRLFFLACAELFAFRRGREWWVTHVLMTRRDEQP